MPTVNKRKKARGFVPFQPVRNPPTGTYDPQLDQGARAGTRGLQDLQQDIGYDPVTGAPTGTHSTRALNDYLLGGNRIDQQQGYTLADILRNQTRSTEDYGTATANVQRQYQRQGVAQSQAANAAGVLNSGWTGEAAAKRAANQALDQQGLDTTHQRQVQDYATQTDRSNTGFDQQRGDLGLNYQRQGEDWQTTLNRATRENQFLGQDTNESKWFQATRYSGYVPPTMPAGEHHYGRFAYRDLGGGRSVSADGTVRTRSQLQSFLRRRRLV